MPRFWPLYPGMRARRDAPPGGWGHHGKRRRQQFPGSRYRLRRRQGVPVGADLPHVGGIGGGDRMRAMHDQYGIAVALKRPPAAKPKPKKKSAKALA
jgi:hypothetical protein